MSSVEEVNTVPRGGALVHVAIGMPVRPENSSETTQVRLNSEPAIKLPEVLIFIAIDGDGTAELQDNRYYLSNEQCNISFGKTTVAIYNVLAQKSLQ